MPDPGVRWSMCGSGGESAMRVQWIVGHQRSIHLKRDTWHDEVECGKRRTQEAWSGGPEVRVQSLSLTVFQRVTAL
jgi:hypothetical protein